MVLLGLCNQQQGTESSRPGERRPDLRYRNHHLIHKSARGPWGWAPGSLLHLPAPRKGPRPNLVARNIDCCSWSRSAGRSASLSRTRPGPASLCPEVWRLGRAGLSAPHVPLPRRWTWAPSSEEAGSKSPEALAQSWHVTYTAFCRSKRVTRPLRSKDRRSPPPGKELRSHVATVWIRRIMASHGTTCVRGLPLSFTPQRDL